MSPAAATTTSSSEELFACHPPSDEMWRRYGEERRRKLIQDDENVGGTAFTINENCELQRYLDLAERVMKQFRVLCGNNLADHVEETYVMGHRLLRFLQTALPEHPEYTPEAGLQCRQDAVWLAGQLKEIALCIDEEQLNLFMDQNFDPLDDDDSSSSEDEGWESLTDWAFKDSSAPRLVDTDTSEQASSDSEAENEEPSGSLLQSPQFLFDIEQEDDFVEADVRYTLNEPVVASNFLKKIANEDVRYESDSEAADSWAQDGNSAAVSGASSGMALTYDPARIAFRELMNKGARELELDPKQDARTSSSSGMVERKRYPVDQSPSDEWPAVVDLELTESAEL